MSAYGWGCSNQLESISSSSINQCPCPHAASTLPQHCPCVKAMAISTHQLNAMTAAL